MTVSHRARVARCSAAVAGLGVGIEALARRVEGGLRDPLPLRSEAAFKLQRLRDVDHRRRTPRVLVIGASVLDADIDPTVVDRELEAKQASFNACLTGSDLATMRRWWRMLQPVVRPEVVVVEAHPGMLLPPGTMADKLHVHLDELADHLSQERRPRRPAVCGVAAAGWPRTRVAVRTAFAPEAEAPSDPAGARNRPNGHLGVFQDVSFEVGSKQLGDDNWYDLVQIDLSADWRHDEYFAFVDELRARVPAVLVAVSPLLLGSAPATAPGAEIPDSISDATVDLATDRGLPIIDLRQWANQREDFADPFHLRAGAVARVSQAVGARVRPMLGGR